MDPVLIRVPDDGLRGRTHDEFFFELGSGIDLDTALILLGAQTVMGYHGTLLGKTLDVLGLAAQERFRNQQGEVGVLSASLLKHLVKLLLHLLPDSIAIRLDHHTSAYGRLLCHIGLYNQIIEPLAVIIGSLC